jgi:hypothetical protein
VGGILEVAHGAKVLFSEKWDDTSGIAAMKIHEDVASRVGGAVLSHDDFIVKISALGQDAVQGLGDESLVVMGNHYHAELHGNTLRCKLTVTCWAVSKWVRIEGFPQEMNYMIAAVGDVPDNLRAILCPR